MPIVIQFANVKSWTEALEHQVVTVYQALLDRETPKHLATGETHHLCSLFAAVNHATNTIYGLTIPQAPITYDDQKKEEMEQRRKRAAIRHQIVAG